MRSLIIRLVILFGLFLLATLSFPVLASDTQVEPLTSPYPANQETSHIRARVPNGNLVPRAVSLPALSSSVVKRSTTATPPIAPEKIGDGRAVNELDDPIKFGNALQWQPTASGGRVAAITVQAAQATGIRLGVKILAIPASAVLRFYAVNSATAFEITGQSVSKLIQTNIDAGDSEDMARMYWGPYIDGESVTLEIELPVGVNPSELQRIFHPFLTHKTRRRLVGGGFRGFMRQKCSH